ncbi:DEAD/DEAH box helicase [Cryomorphaceae bacterium 1068]|nr:DEAD/DEAH box helicase [Cryomorphaceae bacterium 1068]
MSTNIKDQPEDKRDNLTESILKKFDIVALNAMQEEARHAILTKSDVVLLSPTGTGKTLAFLLPLIESLDESCEEIQLLILVPSRELAQQIEQVTREMGSGFKVNAVYGGRAGALDKIDLKHRPAILIGTPGRIADRFRRDRFSLESIQTLVLDEYDKSLEVGFENEMSEIIEALPNVKQRVLTSATSDVEIPSFVELHKPIVINHVPEEKSQLKIKTLLTSKKDKLTALVQALGIIGNEPGIIFVNFKESLERVSDFLAEHEIHHQCFHGDMEQMDRERSLIKFRNGTTRLLLATDLAARGLDIPEIKFILHYHLPPRLKEFTHRNGRTARMNRDGSAYILQWDGEELPEFIREMEPESLILEEQAVPPISKSTQWVTMYVTGGRRDKISKGDLAGLFLKQGQIQKDQLGVIELQQNSSYVGVRAEVAEQLIEKTNNTKLKKKKVRISLI